MKTFRIFFVFLFIMFIMYSSVYDVEGLARSSSGIYMKIHGRVLQRETGTGIKGAIVHFYETFTAKEFEAVTDPNGYFLIRMVPDGIYELNSRFLYLSCPPDLILEEKLEPVKVIVGRNIIDLNIYLKKGASISGRIFKPDGVTPVTQGNVVVQPRLKGKLVDNKIDNNGYYKVVGLGRPGVEELDYSVAVEAVGYADLAKLVKIKNNEEITDFNFVVGKGNVHIKGTVTSSINNRPIKGAMIYVLSAEKTAELGEVTTGDGITDDVGNYSILGFTDPATVDIVVLSDGHKKEEVKKYLKRGDNIINFTLTPVPKTLEPTERKEKAQLRCCELLDLLKQILNDITCGKPTSTDENGKPCIKNNSTLNCMKEKCQKNLIYVVCREDCPKDPDGKVPAGYTDKYNLTGSSGSVVICINSESTFFWAERMFHELYHICDKEAPPDKEEEDYCAEARAYTAMICAFNNSQAENLRLDYQQRCQREKNL
jgi:hypothetical protein